ncbi:hypothetical protein D3C76_505080 [compost metagenome]
MHPLRSRQPAQASGGLFDGVECLGELHPHAFTQRGEPHALGVAFEQGGAVLRLQALDQRGDGAWRYLQLMGCPGKATQTGRCLECTQGIELECVPNR